MLAPLPDRTILERAPGNAQSDDAASDQAAFSALLADNNALKQALRQSRHALRCSASQSAKQIIAQANEINRLREINKYLAERLDAFESSQAMISLGQQLMALTLSNETLTAATQCVCLLDKALCLARNECEYIVQECETAFLQINNPPA